MHYFVDTGVDFDKIIVAVGQISEGRAQLGTKGGWECDERIGSTHIGRNTRL